MGMRTGADVPNDALLECLTCGMDSTVKEWDTQTYSNCTSRFLRRDYISLTRKKAYKEATDTLYQCPHCLCWTEGWAFGSQEEDEPMDFDSDETFFD